jgi:tripartite-type tricarboxylate transporter receptor subunit TctC
MFIAGPGCGWSRWTRALTHFRLLARDDRVRGAARVEDVLKFAARLMTAAALAIALGAASRAAEFPERPVRIIVGFGAGGASDIAARVIANKMGEALGQQVVVENKPGASTSIAAEFVVKSAPDGYTLFQAGNANAANAVSEPPPAFDVLTAFAPIGVAISSPNVLVAHPSSGIKTVQDLIAQAKAHPGQIMYASSGAGSVSNLAPELFAHEQGLKLTHVPYKGSTPAMTDVLAGRVQISFAPISTALPFIKDGRLNALAVTAARRQEQLPDVPTLDEQGIKGIDINIWSGFVAPRGTPPDRIAKLGDALQRALSNPDVRKQLAVHGIETAVGEGPEAWTNHMSSDIDKLKKLIAATGLKLGKE